MTDPKLYEVIDGTWPAAAFIPQGDWLLRDGRGGGKRVSAATARESGVGDIGAAETAMRDLGQPPLFMIRDGDEALDTELERQGYDVIDPVVIYACPVTHLTDIPLPRVTIFEIWEPLAMMLEIWAAGGIGPARIDIMERAEGPKTGLLARFNEKPAGTAFAAIHARTAMVHAVEVLPHQRKQGVGKWIMRGAAFWARAHGAGTLTVMCTRENAGANALYTSLGMSVVGQYHYRHLPKETP
ncbi:GNAT family N-acetyltransferase [Thalassococcus sp. S3]|uniref:GNAT family N-acetyltransferase n=1 Tax=Thalassococcus sp. S3 TaxID=2017482 RepID=UPI0010246FE1|nr:GNAT family N-acetyltransferase [Thalassococcus sp. S3]QBF33134.1 GNAT family N-acetyltransferase [Thalassococcus sp. S3]